MDPNDLFEGADDNYLPESKEDESLGSEDYVVPEDPFEQERLPAAPRGHRSKYEPEAAATASQ